MYKQNRTILRAGLMGLLLACCTCSLSANPPGAPPAGDAVVLTGWLHVDDLHMGDVVLEVEVNGEFRQGSISESGRFTVELPADAEATLRFEKPGHLPKEVQVDTRFIRDGGRSQRTRHVKFAVILEQKRHMGGFVYPDPVGSIAFEEGGGCLAVTHDRSLIPAQQHRPMVF